MSKAIVFSNQRTIVSGDFETYLKMYQQFDKNAYIDDLTDAELANQLRQDSVRADKEQLRAAHNAIVDQLTDEIVEMVGEQYREDVRHEVRFVTDENRENLKRNTVELIRFRIDNPPAEFESHSAHHDTSTSWADVGWLGFED